MKTTQKLLLFSLIAVVSLVLNCSAGGTNGPQGIYIRECVDYIPDYTTIDHTFRMMGIIYGDNRTGTAPMTLGYEHTTSGTVTASIAGHTNLSAEANLVYASMEAETGVSVSVSVSWTEGTTYAASYNVPPGNYENLVAYLPAVRTAGRLIYEVYMDGYPDNVFYQYDDLDPSYAPQSNGIYFRIESGV